MVYTKQIECKTKGRLSTELHDKYKELEKTFSKKFLTCGTTLAHALYDINISVCQTRDKEAGLLEAGWANDLFITAMQYCKSSVNQSGKLMEYDFQYKSKPGFVSKKPFSGASWLELHMPLIYLYNRADIEKLVVEGKAKYYELGRDSAMQGVFNSVGLDQHLGEYHVLDRTTDMPEPAVIIIGGASGNFSKADRDAMLGKLDTLPNKYPSSKIFYYPKIKLGTSKKKGETGTNLASLKALKIIQDIEASL